MPTDSPRDDQGLGLGPNSVRHVHDPGNEEDEDDVLLELSLECADDRCGDQRAH
jgi:hypothetical protein